MGLFARFFEESLERSVASSNNKAISNHKKASEKALKKSSNKNRPTYSSASNNR